MIFVISISAALLVTLLILKVICKDDSKPDSKELSRRAKGEFRLTQKEFEKMYRHDSRAYSLYNESSRKLSQFHELYRNKSYISDEDMEKMMVLYNEVKELRKRVHDEYQELIRVVIPGFELPEKFAHPTIFYYRPENYEEYTEIMNKTICIRNKLHKLTSNHKDECLTLQQIINQAILIHSLKGNPRFNKLRNNKRYNKSSNIMFSSKFRQCLPPPDGGYGFSMDFNIKLNEESNDHMISFYYPSQSIDISGKILKELGEVDSILKKLNKWFFA